MNNKKTQKKTQKNKKQTQSQKITPNKDMPDHIEEYFSKVEGSKEAFHSRELFKGDEENIDLKTHISDEEIVLINTLKFNNKMLEEAGLEPVFNTFIHNYLRLKVSKDRLSRGEFVNINKQENTEEELNKFANLKNITDSKK